MLSFIVCIRFVCCCFVFLLRICCRFLSFEVKRVWVYLYHRLHRNICVRRGLWYCWCYYCLCQLFTSSFFSPFYLVLCAIQEFFAKTDSWCGASERIQSDQWFDHNETTIRFHMYMNTSVVMENQFCFSFISLYVRNMTLSLQYFIPSFYLIWCDQWSKLFARFILHFPLIPSHFSRILSDSRRFSSAEFSSKISCAIKRYEMSQVCLVSKWLIYGGVECIATH